jgi:hypothetical protein
MPKSLLQTFFFSLVLVSLAGTANAFQKTIRVPSEPPETMQTGPSAQQQQLERAAEVAQGKSSTSDKSQRSAADLVKLSQDADELSKLAQTIPGDVNQISNGVLPKDVEEKLKRIQKLAKQLRSGITQ